MASLTKKLLRFILAEVCSMTQAPRAAGLSELRVAMNVSPREMVQIAVDEIVLDRMEELGLPAAMLEIEITEKRRWRSKLCKPDSWPLRAPASG